MTSQVNLEEHLRNAGIPLRNGKDSVDLVNSPSHYKGKGTFEAIDVIEAFGLNYHLGNVIKYCLRADKKGEPLQDLEKASWYLQREIARRKAVR